MYMKQLVSCGDEDGMDDNIGVIRWDKNNIGVIRWDDLSVMVMMMIKWTIILG